MTYTQDPRVLRVLSLDGGGAKGFYTLGVLKGIEGMVGGLLHEHFNLIYGTSTGSIIAALLALGHSVDDIHRLYKDHVLQSWAGGSHAASQRRCRRLPRRFLRIKITGSIELQMPSMFENDNRVLVEQICGSNPCLTDVALAGKAIPGMHAHRVLHTGPPIEWPDHGMG